MITIYVLTMAFATVAVTVGALPELKRYRNMRRVGEIGNIGTTPPRS